MDLWIFLLEKRKSYRYADQWWAEADLLNLQNFVKSYLPPIACIRTDLKVPIHFDPKHIEMKKDSVPKEYDYHLKV